MDQLGQWRVIAAEPEESADKPSAANTQRASSSARGIAGWQLTIVLGGLIVAIVGAAIWLTVPRPALTLDTHGAAIELPAGSAALASDLGVAAATDAPTSELVVDVEGAVARPGLVTLPDGSRVGDAISAAGGYSGQVDVVATAAQLNLAQPLKDGEKVRVPARGETGVVATPAPVTDPATAGSLIDINHASADELDTLPGVGPVTAGKIISAREEAPFAAADELVSRGVMGQATYDKLSSLITVTP